MENACHIFKSICRICLFRGDGEIVVPLIDKSSSDGLSCFGRSVQILCDIRLSNDDLPSFMCSKCLTLLKQAISFKKTCRKSQKRLQNLLKKTLESKVDFCKELVEIVSSKSVFLHKNRKKLLTKDAEYFDSSVKYPETENIDKIKYNFKNETRKLDLQESLMSNDEKPYLLDNSDGGFNGPNDQILNTTEIIVLKDLKSEKLEHTRAKTRKIHKKKVEESKEFTCKFCNKSLKTSFSLERHEKRHKRVFICEHCAKSYHSSKELDYHLACTHNIGEVFVCNECGKKCFSKFRLKEHIRKHTGEKPFICNTCGMKFHTRFVWMKHVKRHTNKSVPCKVCNKLFHCISDMKSHMNSNHERRYVYTCNYCENTYAKTGTARRHMAEKHGVNKEDQGKITRVILDRMLPGSNMKLFNRKKNFNDNEND